MHFEHRFLRTECLKNGKNGRKNTNPFLCSNTEYIYISISALLRRQREDVRISVRRRMQLVTNTLFHLIIGSFD